MNNLIVNKDFELAAHCETCGRLWDHRANDVAQTIGARVRWARGQIGWNLHELADATGISCGFLSKIENDRSTLSLRTLQILARTLGKDVIWFVEALDCGGYTSVDTTRDNNSSE